MKGISTVIATLLMLMITIGLAGMAYMYIRGVFTGITSKTITIVDVGCVPGTSYYVVVKNLDSSLTITPSTDLIVRVDNAVATTITWNPTSITPGGISSGTITNPAGGAAGTAHKIKVTGPSNSDEKSVYC
ncbi:MAG: hypothetical protein QXU74_01610 [Candidatus Aenigmatarchaeota archaeon]